MLFRSIQAKNPNKSFEVCLVDTGTSKEDSLEGKNIVYVLKATYHKLKQKYINLEDIGKYLQIEKEDHRMDLE